MQQQNTMPGYTGFKPQEEAYVSPALRKELAGNQAGTYKVPGILYEHLIIFRLRWLCPRR